MSQADLRVALEAIAFGADPDIKPADRLRALGELRQLQGELPSAVARARLLLADTPDDELEHQLAQVQEAVAYEHLRGDLDAVAATLVGAGACAQRAAWPRLADALDQEVARRAELRARELADADRLEAVALARAQAQLAEQAPARDDAPAPAEAKAAPAPAALTLPQGLDVRATAYALQPRPRLRWPRR